jgi:hypothetical protein
MRSLCVYVFVCFSFQVLSQLADFREMWYERHAVRVSSITALFNFLHSDILVVAAARTLCGGRDASAA